ncbi:unnamed protein product [Dovyalis caffra]|uniref:Sulfotransferase n=1 Tax=Dovyalis caffra TaxID=77055 RepID=A0AAV1QR67_9ROSI|nr:unnamed protein product [Dovyalis caffra]
MTDASKINESSNTNNKYEEIISNLPQDNGWKPFGKLYNYQGFWDPKDALISHWIFDIKVSGIGLESFPLEEALEQYCKGVYPFGPYWDHVLGFCKASLEFPEKVLFVKYEDLKNDGPFHVTRMAEFMGHPFSVEEKQQGVPEKIMNMCSFENLSSLEVNKKGKYNTPDFSTIENKSFFRKGKAGDWKNHLTNEKAEKLDQIMK